MKYWVERNLKAQENLSNRSIKATEKQLTKYYQTTMKKVIDEFERTYDKLLLSVEQGREPTPADLYKLDTYWQMQAQIQQELQKLGDKEVALLTKQFRDTYLDIYNTIAIPGGVTFSTIDAAMATQMINQVWCADGISWSQRVWKNTELLRESLNEELINCVVTGKKTTDLKNMLQDRFGVSYNNADMLVRTEISNIQTQAAQKRYKDYGIQEVEVWADKDERQCEVCGKLHQKRYPIGSKMPVPVHPRCRCTILPVVE